MVSGSYSAQMSGVAIASGHHLVVDNRVTLRDHRVILRAVVEVPLHMALGPNKEP